MVGGTRRKPAPRVAQEGGPVRPGVKGKVYLREEEEQLCRSVMHVSQDRIVGNQQRAGVFWERVSEHYDDNRLAGLRPQRSLETKWGHVKHDVSKWIGVHSQVMKLARSGSSVADNLKRAHDLYQQKDAKGCEFVYEHCWLIVRDNPRWALGWAQEKPPTPTRLRGEGSEQEMPEAGDGSMSRPSSAAGSGSGPDSEVADYTRTFKGRPGGTKAAKDEVCRSKMREGGLYAQAAATYKVAEAQMLKAVGFADQNLLLLMTTDDSALVNA
jgi:hypothetical protein